MAPTSDGLPILALLAVLSGKPLVSSSTLDIHISFVKLVDITILEGRIRLPNGRQKWEMVRQDSLRGALAQLDPADRLDPSDLQVCNLRISLLMHSKPTPLGFG